MTFKRFVTAVLLLIPASSVFAVPELSIVPEGIQAGNWVWRVDLVPDLVLAGGSTPLAVELGFRLTGAPLLSATNINPSEFDLENPGNFIFGWETPDPTANNFPVGLQVNLATDEIFVAYGSEVFTTPGPKPFLEIITQGPASGGGPSTTIEWLGAYNGNGRIAQLTGPTSSANFDIPSGTATQMIPEPASTLLVAFGTLWLVLPLRSRHSTATA